ncbi:segregation and condensation protein B [Thermasporomyces composti]|uniref:Segregation and condensation protein B n=1 Tax=Thermasporomyces composti TaxID=696763 RepID=A0A3D9VBE7_THECX|nr:segregation and condensation protein B [Thermasporomyces composti]
MTEGEREVPESAGTERSADDVWAETSGTADVRADAAVEAAGAAEGAGAAEDTDDSGAREAEADGLDVTMPDDLFGPIEAIMMVVDEPLPAITLAQVLDRPVPEVEEALQKLAESYTAEGRGFELRQVGGGWRFYTREKYAEIVERFVLDGQQAKLTQAALETLAVVAYQQPVSRARVSAIRGVNCDGVVRTLLARGLIEEAGTDRESGATLYRTTSYFLERLGLRSLDELPSLAPYLPEVDEVEQEEAIAPAATDVGVPGAGGSDGSEPTVSSEVESDESKVRVDGGGASETDAAGVEPRVDDGGGGEERTAGAGGAEADGADAAAVSGTRVENTDAQAVSWERPGA